jgi:hypothetical protein
MCQVFHSFLTVRSGSFHGGCIDAALFAVAFALLRTARCGDGTGAGFVAASRRRAIAAGGHATLELEPWCIRRCQRCAALRELRGVDCEGACERVNARTRWQHGSNLRTLVNGEFVPKYVYLDILERWRASNVVHDAIQYGVRQARVVFVMTPLVKKCDAL